MNVRFVCLSIVLLSLAGTAQAQLIPIRTVPIAQADQFDFFPSNNAAMGGVSIALADSLSDPFNNPAKGSRLTGGYFHGSPMMYRVSGDGGAGRTLPLAALSRRGSWFTALSLALQEVDPSQRTSSPVPVVNGRFVGGGSGPALNQARGNQFAFAAIGKTLPGGLSIGGSAFWAGLRAVDGVDLLYSGSSQINQVGHAAEFRLGVLKEWAGDQAFEALVLHNRFRMKHDVTFEDVFWDPATQQTALRPRLQHNLDYTSTWGLHFTYERPLSDSGWRIGWVATANRASHPKLPEYDVATVGILPIPWDPGYSYANNVGLGVSKVYGASRFGMDAIYEPIWTYTWGEAPEPMATRTGGTIPAGGKTIENHFRFSNAVFRMGASRDDLFGVGGLGIQFGLMVHSIQYHLSQFDDVAVTSREQEEHWVEWTPTWGMAFRFSDMEIRYRGHVTNGTGRPGVSRNPGGGVGFLASADRSVGGDILVAPDGPLTLSDVSLFSHQFSISIPLGRPRRGTR